MRLPSGPEARALAASWLGRLIGAAAGAAAGWFGVFAGFLIGSMLDEARAEAKARKRIEAYYLDPDSCPPEEGFPGLAAAMALAAIADWGDSREGPRLLLRLAREELPADRGRERCLQRMAEAAKTAPASSLPALSRSLALRGAPAVRQLMARFAYELRLAKGLGLDHASDGRLRLALADCGLGSAEIEAARRMSFPAYRDPWDVLGLERGASLSELRRAWRRLSRSCHPDLTPAGPPAGGSAAGAQDGAARFRELREAYEIIRGLRSW